MGCLVVLLAIVGKALLQIGKLLLRLITLLLLIIFLPYVFTPVYDFEPTTPFSGKGWYNPYEQLADSVWKANFHAHSYAWWGLTNGKNSPAEMAERYAELGYHAPALSNYHRIEPEQAAQQVYIPAYEHGVNIWKRHHGAVNAREVDYWDYIFWQSLNHKQYKIERIAPTVSVLTINHPKLRDGYQPADMEVLRGYTCIEVLNHYRKSFEHWDKALSAGVPVWGIGNDDSHSDSYDECGKYWNMILSPSSDTASLMQALRAGAFYALEGERGEVDLLPSAIQISDSLYTISLPAAVESIALIGHNGNQVASVTKDSVLRYQPKSNDTYLRAVITTAHTTVYTNPVFRGEKKDLALPKKNILLTIGSGILHAIGYIVLLVVTIKFWFRRKKKSLQQG